MSKRKLPRHSVFPDYRARNPGVQSASSNWLAAEDQAQPAESLLASLQVPQLSDIEILWIRET
jgi:hypothetical protein